MTPHARHGLPPAYLVEIDRLPDVALLERYAIEYGCRHPALLALVDELRRGNSPRVRNERRAARGQRSVEYPGDETGVWLLVQHVRRDDKLEASHVMRKTPPVADARVDQRPGVHQHVERCEAQRFVVVIRRRDIESSDRCGDRHETGAVAKLQESSA